MVTIEAFSALAVSFPETTEEPHFEKISFRVKHKIFATYDAALHRAVVKLSLIHQDVFATAAREIIYPVPNKWGLQGWTIIDLHKVEWEICADALTTAYCEVAPKKLADTVLRNNGKT